MVASGKSLNPDPQLVGRDAELSRLRALLDGARAGTGGSLVLEGEAGIGKTSLLTEAMAMATGFTSLATVGIESEAALGCAGLLDVLTPLRERLSETPTVQAEALSAVLGWGPARTTADPFLVAAGTLSLLARQAEDKPVLVRVDDAHWVDQTSLAALAFAARRLTFDAVAFPSRRPEPGARTSTSCRGFRSWRSKACPRASPLSCSRVTPRPPWSTG